MKLQVEEDLVFMVVIIFNKKSHDLSSHYSKPYISKLIGVHFRPQFLSTLVLNIEFFFGMTCLLVNLNFISQSCLTFTPVSHFVSILVLNIEFFVGRLVCDKENQDFYARAVITSRHSAVLG